MRDFEKISFEQFKKDIGDNKELYNSYKLPSRNSTNAAGYDFYLIKDIEIKPNEIIKIPTGIKAYFQPDEVLFIIVRSSTGFKYNIRLVNQVGVIDADYYNNKDNEGHIFIKIQNEGTQTIKFNAGDHLAQGIFINFLKAKSDKNIESERTSNY